MRIEVLISLVICFCLPYLLHADGDLEPKEPRVAATEVVIDGTGRLIAGQAVVAPPGVSVILVKNAAKKSVRIRIGNADGRRIEKMRCEVDEQEWSILKHDTKPLKLIHQEDGFCFLSYIGGAFRGDGEEVGVRVGKDGHWNIVGRSRQPNLNAKAITVQALEPDLFRSDVKEFSWKRSENPVKMIHQTDGFCFLSSVTGKLQGFGEEVRVHLGEDGYWYLRGRSMQFALGAKAICVRVREPGSLEAEIVTYKWQAGDEAVKMLNSREGFCFLSAISGTFKGREDGVGISLGKDGFWYLSGNSRTKQCMAEATGIRLVRAKTDS